MDAIQIVLFVILAILLLWASILTYLYLSSVKHYKKLTIGKGEGIEDVVNIIFRGLETLNSNFEEARREIEKLKSESAIYIQKVSLRRFNPFGDTGGDQSFSFALLDKDDTGIVLSSLHGRSGTRVYAKPVKEGKSEGYEFSDEEEEVIYFTKEKHGKRVSG